MLSPFCTVLGCWLSGSESANPHYSYILIHFNPEDFNTPLKSVPCSCQTPLGSPPVIPHAPASGDMMKL